MNVNFQKGESRTDADRSLREIQAPHPWGGPKLWTSVALFALLVLGAFWAWWIWVRTDSRMRKDLILQTQLVAQAVNVDRFSALTGTDADLVDPEYQRIKAQLAAFRFSNSQYRFIYLMGRRADGSVYFIMDVGQEDEAPPGEVYDDASAELRNLFDSGVPFVEGPLPDEWGVWVSALVPVVDPKTGAWVAVLGLDVDARDWKWILARAALPSVLLTLALVAWLWMGVALVAWRARSGGMPHIELGLGIALGLIFTLFAAWMAHARETHDRANSFEQLAASQTLPTAEMLRELLSSGLEGLAHFFESDEEVVSAEFLRFTDYLTKNPAVTGWEWIPAVWAEDKARFESAARDAGLTGFEIWQKDAQGQRVPATGRAVYYPVLMVAPLAGNESAVGFDLGSEPLRRAALEDAARTGLTTGTDPLTLVHETGNQKGMLVFRPVFGVGAPKRLRGFAVAMLQMRTLLRNATPDNSAHIELSLLRKDAAPEMLATTWNTEDHLTPDLAVARPVFAFGQTFTLTALAGPEFLRRHPARAGGLAILIGLILTAALAIVIRTISGRRVKLERRVAERTRELRESEALQRVLLDNLPAGVIIVDPVTRVIERVNDYVATLFGASVDHLVGNRCHKLLCPATEGACPVCDLGQTVDNSERVLLQSDGGRLAILKTVKKVQLNGQEKLLECFVDISERKKAESLLAQTAARLALATQAAGVGIWDYDIVKNVLVWDDQMYRLYGITADRFGGAYESWQAGLHPDDRVRGNAEIQMALRGEKNFDTEFRVLWPDGGIHTLRALAHVQRDSTGQPLHMIGTNWDITVQRKRTEELAETIRDLQLFNELTINRELFMIELKRQINDLQLRLGDPPAYDLQDLEPTETHAKTEK